MARVRFTRDFDYHPTEQCTIGYLAGAEETVRRECADQAIAAGAGFEIEIPGKVVANGKATIGG